MKARISARAQSDLDRIFAWIYVRQGPTAADQFLQLAKEATALSNIRWLVRIPRGLPGTKLCGFGSSAEQSF